MTAKQILSLSLTALGYVDSAGNPDHTAFIGQAMAAVNTIYAELYYCANKSGFKPVANYEEQIILPERLLYDCMHYGVAMLIAQSENDNDSQRMFAELYNNKLGAANQQMSIIDVLPEVAGV